ncbi:MAG TPA: hypothetical protein VHH73_14110 [Verrucomicrobiae bacterium]|nr:hypothetical protein [Verrucomicrobiae bacterium]
MSGHSFVLTPMDFCEEPVTEIAPKHKLAKATKEQITQFKQFIDKFGVFPGISWAHYEHNYREVLGEKPGNISYHPEALDQEKWRYWVVCFDGNNSLLRELQWACALIPNHIELGFTFLYGDAFPKGSSGHMYDGSAIQSFVNDHLPPTKVKQLCQEDLKNIRQIFDQIKSLPQRYDHIRRALTRFDNLRTLPRHSELNVIGLVSVIESLVSHAPKLTDSADSLSHQLRTKIPLLWKRFTFPLNQSEFFTDIQEEKLWSKVYSYRSKIVHGEDAALTGDLQLLKTQELVIDFLREVTKRLLHLSLCEPRFMTDLKKC